MSMGQFLTCTVHTVMLYINSNYLCVCLFATFCLGQAVTAEMWGAVAWTEMKSFTNDITTPIASEVCTCNSGNTNENDNTVSDLHVLVV